MLLQPLLQPGQFAAAADGHDPIDLVEAFAAAPGGRLNLIQQVLHQLRQAMLLKHAFQLRSCAL